MEPYSIDPMFTGMSLQSLLNLNPSLLSLLTDHPPPQQPQLSNYYIQPRHHDEPFNFIQKRPRLHYYSSGCSSSSSSSSTPSSHPAKPLPPKSNFARQRRQKLSEKTRCLQKLMPWDKKMDQATLFEQAYTYVKFLQAQVSVLQSMPYHTPPPPPQPSSFNNGGRGCVFGFGDLERLSRNQLLQVLMNSPVAQTVMSSQGLCVFSMEQLELLTKLSERRLLLQGMNANNINMNMASDSKPFFN